MNRDRCCAAVSLAIQHRLDTRFTLHGNQIRRIDRFIYATVSLPRLLCKSSRRFYVSRRRRCLSD